MKRNGNKKMRNFDLACSLIKKGALVLAFSLLFASCSAGGKNATEGSLKGNSASEAESSDQAGAASDASDKKVRVGILQFARHASLDNCRDGFLKGLENSGFSEGKNLEVELKNADADMGNLSQMAKNFVSEKLDLICAIATPAAMSAYNAAMDSGIPVVYTAVNDPIASELAGKDKMPLGNVTGSSDALPVEDQLKLIREILPNASKLGIIYTTSEVNSISTIEVYKNLVGKYGFELITEGVSTSSDIPAAADSILSKVDVITNLTDNTVVNSLPLILDKAFAAGKPVFGSEVEQVKLGCLASSGIEYLSLGEQTGEMAGKILKGETKASEMPFEVFSDSFIYLNTDTAKALNIEFSKELTGKAAEIFPG